MTNYSMPMRPTLLTQSVRRKPTYAEAIAMAIRYEFGAANWRRADLARILGKHQGRITALWHGRRPIDYVELAMVAKALGIEIEKLTILAERMRTERTV